MRGCTYPNYILIHVNINIIQNILLGIGLEMQNIVKRFSNPRLLILLVILVLINLALFSVPQPVRQPAPNPGLSS